MAARVNKVHEVFKDLASILQRSKERKSSYLHDHTHDGERKNLPWTRRGPPVDVVASFNVKKKPLLVESVLVCFTDCCPCFQDSPASKHGSCFSKYSGAMSFSKEWKKVT